MRCRISRLALAAIRQESALVSPREACGLLLGSAAAITGWQVAENVAQDPHRHFEIDPRALFAALREERAGGAALAGYWHSHPSGDATPSKTDAAMAAPDGKLWLIVGGDTATLWQAGHEGLHGRFAAVEIAIEN
jgi:proteasome lid subunit RPN8/RPN11